MAALQKYIDMKNQYIDSQEKLIKSQQIEIQALKESLASAIRSKQQELETLKESQASEIRILMVNHAEHVAKIKTKVWCSNQCGSEGIFHCCVNVSYYNPNCQVFRALEKRWSQEKLQKGEKDLKFILNE